MDNEKKTLSRLVDSYNRRCLVRLCIYFLYCCWRLDRHVCIHFGTPINIFN